MNTQVIHILNKKGCVSILLFFLVPLRFTQKNRFDIAYISDLGDFSTAHILTFPGCTILKILPYVNIEYFLGETPTFFLNTLEK